MRWGCFRWGIQEDFSEEVAFELRPKGSEGGGPWSSVREESTRQREEPGVLRNDVSLARAE